MITIMSFRDKYLKYKTKYLNSKMNSKMVGGSNPEKINAICVINGDKTYDKNIDINGTLYFNELDNGQTKIYGTILGLSDGEHGIHIHESADMTQCCQSLKAHYNPFGKDHGAPFIIDQNGKTITNPNRHVGDLGNIKSINGKAEFELIDDLVKLSGKYSVIGRSIIIHNDKDDLGLGGTEESKKTGTSGKRIACGIIGLL